MEITDLSSKVVSTPNSEEAEVNEKDLNEEEDISLDKTIQVENSSLKSKDILNESATNQENNFENGKKKVKDEKPPSKIVVRRLPPTMTKDQFLEQVSPLPEVDYMYYIQGDVNNNINPYSRAYLNFVNQEDLFSFSRTFDNYVFLDAKGQEFPAVVEFAMFQRFPKQRTKKKDPLMGTIEADPAFITFKENLLAEALENSKPGGKAIKQHYFETEISASEEVNTTPLLEYLKVRRAEKARIREERREEKKRKEVERKLKQKSKDKKLEDENDEEPSKEVKIQPKQTDKCDAEMIVRKNKQVLEKEIVGKSDTSKTKKDELKNQSFVNPPESKILILKSASESKKDVPCDDGFYKSDHSDQNSSMSLISTKCDNFISNNPKMGQLVQKVEELKIKEAEQQTLYLRKMLGLVSDNSNNSEKNIVDTNNSKIPNSSVINVCIPEELSKTEPPEEVLSAFKEYINTTKKKDILWSKHNINPALPSASFKCTSSSSLNCGDSSVEQRSLSAPRRPSETSEVSDSGLGRQVASSTPNVSLSQTDATQKVLHVSRLLKKDESYSAVHSQSSGEEVLQPRERKDFKERDSRNTKKKEEKDKSRESRAREFKGRGGKSYQEERLKLAERREELKKKEQQHTSDKGVDCGDSNDFSENIDQTNEQSKSCEEKSARQEKKRYENRKSNKYDNEDWKDDSKKRNRMEKNNSKREGRDRKEEYSKRNSEKKNVESESRKKSKVYKESKPDKKKTVTSDDQNNQETKNSDSKEIGTNEENNVPDRKTRSWNDLTVIGLSENNTSVASETKDSTVTKKRCSSLESSRSENNVEANELMTEVEKIMSQKKENLSKNLKQTETSSFLRSRKDLSSKKTSIEEKTPSCNKNENFEETKEADQTTKHSSQENIETSGNKSRESTTRAERRIRNKDRPSIEIYRPGMGKFSKQRLEKEKALGSSTEVESPSHSPSPTPKSKLIS